MKKILLALTTLSTGFAPLCAMELALNTTKTSSDSEEMFAAPYHSARDLEEGLLQKETPVKRYPKALRATILSGVGLVGATIGATITTVCMGESCDLSTRAAGAGLMISGSAAIFSVNAWNLYDEVTRK